MTEERTRGKRTVRPVGPRIRPDAGLLQALGLHRLLPETMAGWRFLLLDGVSFFLERLPAPRLAAIVAEQLAFPASARPERRIAALLAHCPTLHKVGQMVARHRSLPPAVRRQLQALESLPARAALPETLVQIRAELGSAPIVVASQALAEGSVALVVPFTYRENAAIRGEIRHGVLKVLKPGIEARVADELLILAELEGFLEQRGQALGLPPLDYRETLRSAQRLLRKEVHFANEQHNLRAAAAFYADQPRVLIPRLLPWCTPRITAMERVFGGKVTAADLPAPARRALADTLISALLGQPFWNPSEDALFHADLHAGNLLRTDDGRLAIIDWSLAAGLAKTQREALLAIAVGGLTLDAPAIRAALAGLGALHADDPALAAAVEASLDRLAFQARLPGFDWLMELLDDVALQTTARFAEELLLFRKTWLALSGVLGDLVDRASPDLPLLRLGVQRFLAEWPARWLASPDSRAFSTHLSNAELVRLCAAPWLMAIRYGLRCSRRPLVAR